MSLLLNGIARLGQSLTPNTSQDIAQLAQQSTPLTTHDDTTKIEVPKTVSFTAQMCAAARAMESKRPKPHLIDDPLAEALAGPLAMARVQQALENKEFDKSPRIVIRTRYFDDYIVDSIRELSQQHDAHCKVQLVLLGSGMDTRAYRLPILNQIASIFEVDAKDVVDLKQSILKTVQPPPNSMGPAPKVIVADLVEDNWPSMLVDNGFDEEAPTIWIVEGVLYYLRYVHVVRLLRQISEHSPPNSKLGFSAISHLKHSKDVDKNSARASLFKSAMPDPPGLLESTGFRADHVDVFGGPRVNFGRCAAEELREKDAWKTGREAIYVTATKV